jgi:hypothetical protein
VIAFSEAGVVFTCCDADWKDDLHKDNMTKTNTIAAITKTTVIESTSDICIFIPIILNLLKN